MRSALGFTGPFCGQLLAACSLGPRHPQEVNLRIWFWFLGAFFLILVCPGYHRVSFCGANKNMCAEKKRF